MNKKNRFDLEEEISSLHSIADQLGCIGESYIKYNLTNEEIITAVKGIKVILDIQAQKLHDTMCECFNLK
jgi:hypothetical protein